MKNLHIAAAATSLLLLTACSSKVSQFKADQFMVNPSPLAVQGQRVPATITANVPAKFLPKNAAVTITPTLVYAGGETSSAPYLIQGTGVRDNGTVIDYATGGTVMIPVSVPYTAAMDESVLALDFQVNQGGKKYALPRVNVGKGLITTATLATPTSVTPAVAADGFQRVINQTYATDIHFLINQANIQAAQTGKAEYKSLAQTLKEAAADPGREIAGISVSSYASPEGAYDFNKGLAERREKSTNSLVESQLKKDNITEFGELTSQFTPEDWDGFRRLVEQSDIQDKELIIAALNNQSDPELREKEIRSLAKVFDELATQILPQLRYSRIQATISTIGKSDRELVDLFNTNPGALSADELLYIATLTGDVNKKMEVYNRACELLPGDYRAFNNLGMTQYMLGDWDGAEANFRHAARLNPGAHEPVLNLGLIDLVKGNGDAAYQAIGSAADVPESAQALGLYYLQAGNVPAAVQALKGQNSNNAALAQILSEDYAGARSTLSAIQTPDATTYYLMAVLGARTNNESMAISNLRQAVRLDGKLLERAKKDLEFSRINLSYL